jgi:hypothetical protein
LPTSGKKYSPAEVVDPPPILVICALFQSVITTNNINWRYLLVVTELKAIVPFNLRRLKLAMEKKKHSQRSIQYALAVVRQVYKFALCKRAATR